MRRTRETLRMPNEDMVDYVSRLERARLQAIGEHKEMAADALEAVADHTDNPHLIIEARAQRAAADEFFKAIEEMERGAGD